MWTHVLFDRTYCVLHICGFIKNEDRKENKNQLSNKILLRKLSARLLTVVSSCSARYYDNYLSEVLKLIFDLRFSPGFCIVFVVVYRLKWFIWKKSLTTMTSLEQIAWCLIQQKTKQKFSNNNKHSNHSTNFFMQMIIIIVDDAYQLTVLFDNWPNDIYHW